MEELFKTRGKGGVLRELKAEVLRVKGQKNTVFAPNPHFIDDEIAQVTYPGSCSYLIEAINSNPSSISKVS